MAGELNIEKGLDPVAPPASTVNIYPRNSDARVVIQDASDNKPLILLSSDKAVANGVASLDGSGDVPSAQISEASVTAHEAALAIAASQTTSGTFADARVAESNVTQHEAALAIAASQVTGALPASQVAGFVLTAVGTTHTFADADHALMFDMDNADNLAFTLPNSGVAVNKVCAILVRSTGDLSFVVDTATIAFDDVSYAAGPVCTGKGMVYVRCLASGVYWIDGGLDLAVALARGVVGAGRLGRQLEALDGAVDGRQRGTEFMRHIPQEFAFCFVCGFCLGFSNFQVTGTG